MFVDVNICGMWLFFSNNKNNKLVFKKDNGTILHIIHIVKLPLPHFSNSKLANHLNQN